MILEVIALADSILRDNAKEFAKKIVFLCRDMKSNHKESVLINQLLRSSTSIGANLHEAQYAQSTNDFISKFEIAQNECGAIRRMLISSLKTIKSK